MHLQEQMKRGIDTELHGTVLFTILLFWLLYALMMHNTGYMVGLPAVPMLFLAAGLPLFMLVRVALPAKKLGLLQYKKFSFPLQSRFLVCCGVCLVPVLWVLHDIMLWHIPSAYHDPTSQWLNRLAVALSGLVFGNPLGMLAFWSVLTHWFDDNDEESQRFNLPAWRHDWVRFFIPLWLLGESEQVKQYYMLHGHWRTQVYFTQLYRRWQHWQLRRSLLQYRWVLVLVAGGLTLLIFPSVFKWLFNQDLKAWADIKNPAMGTVVTALLGAGVLFVLWYFRDQNALWQIENNRKDINLKDFQRISEWAAGMHLPEDKRTETEKIDPKKTIEPKPTGTTEQIKKPEQKESTGHLRCDTCKEQTISTEKTLTPPDRAQQHPMTRREGAESLQIAAIYQMASFLNGEFGVHFQRPAFRLLTSIYGSLHPDVEQKFKALPGYATLQDANATPEQWRQAGQDLRRTAKAWREQAQFNTPLQQALDATLFAQRGRILQQHAIDLPDLVLHGAHFNRSVLEQPMCLPYAHLAGVQAVGVRWQRVELQGANLQGANLQGADLRAALMQGAKLIGAKLQGADLSFAKLQTGDLGGVNLQSANLEFAQLQGVMLQRAQLQRSILKDVSLQGANLEFAQLTGANLMHAELQYANFEQAQIQGAYLIWSKLQGAKLARAQLESAVLLWSKLQYANLSDANLSFTRLEGVNLSNAELQRANLLGANLLGANLECANLCGAELQEALFFNCKWNDATQWDGAKVKGTVFAQGRKAKDYFIINASATAALHVRLAQQGVQVDPTAIRAGCNAYNYRTKTWVCYNEGAAGA